VSTHGAWNPTMPQQGRHPYEQTGWSAPTARAYDAPNASPIGAVDDAAHVRRSAIFRVHEMTFKHTAAFAEPPAGRVPGPHAFALLFAGRGRLGGTEVYAATRMFQDTDDTRPKEDVRNLQVLLEHRYRSARSHHDRGGWNPFDSMDKADPQINDGAQFIGCATSTIGTPDQHLHWGSVKTGPIGLKLASHCQIRLTDGTWIELLREPDRTIAEVSSTDQTLDLVSFRRGPRIPSTYTPHPGSTHDWLDQLTQLYGRAFRERQNAGQRATGRRRA
jgi:hypothetical protein